jgi:invasion protein IalB
VTLSVRAARPAVAIVLAVLATADAWGQNKSTMQGQVPPPTASTRTEILTYDNWTVTCRDPSDPKDKRICSAQLDIVQEANNTRRVMLSWIIGLSKDGALTTVLHFPTGVSIAPGIELKFGEKAPRKIPITTCEPAYCEATAPMDDGFVKDALPIVQAEAVVQASDGRQVNFAINMKGFTQALAAMRK